MSLTIPIKPLILIGSPGSGRQAIIYHLTSNLPHKFQRVIAHTSRPPRSSERDKYHFHFVNESEIKDKRNKFITITKSINENYYGLAKQEIERVIAKNKIPIFRMTLEAYKANIKESGNGKVFIHKEEIECNALYIDIPDLGELENRLKHSPFCEAQCKQKIETASKEIKQAGKFFMKPDHINCQNIDETIIHVKSRLFDLY